MATKHVIKVTLNDGTIAYTRHRKDFDYFTTDINEACVYTKAMIPDERIKELENKIKFTAPLINWNKMKVLQKEYKYTDIILIEKIEVNEVRTVTIV